MVAAPYLAEGAAVAGLTTWWCVDALWWIRDAARVSRRGGAADRLGGLRDDVARLVEVILEGKGAVSREARQAAFAGRADDPALTDYVDIVRRHASRVTDEDVERLRAGGLDDDAIFELTVAAALGAGVERLQVGLSLLGGER
jgi:hypothetical protein